MFYMTHMSDACDFFIPRFVTGSAAVDVELASPLLAIDQNSINRLWFCIEAGNHCVQY